MTINTPSTLNNPLIESPARQNPLAGAQDRSALAQRPGAGFADWLKRVAPDKSSAPSTRAELHKPEGSPDAHRKPRRKDARTDEPQDTRSRSGEPSETPDSDITEYQTHSGEEGAGMPRRKQSADPTSTGVRPARDQSREHSSDQPHKGSALKEQHAGESIDQAARGRDESDQSATAPGPAGVRDDHQQPAAKSLEPQPTEPGSIEPKQPVELKRVPEASERVKHDSSAPVGKNAGEPTANQSSSVEPSSSGESGAQGPSARARADRVVRDRAVPAVRVSGNGRTISIDRPLTARELNEVLTRIDPALAGRGIGGVLNDPDLPTLPGPAAHEHENVGVGNARRDTPAQREIPSVDARYSPQPAPALETPAPALPDVQTSAVREPDQPRDATRSPLTKHSDDSPADHRDRPTDPPARAVIRESASTVPSVAPSAPVVTGLREPAPASPGTAPAGAPTRVRSTGAVTSSATRTSGPSSPARGASEQSLAAQVNRGVNAAMNQKGGAVTIRLTPESLGQMRVHMELQHGRVGVRLEVGSSSARALLDEHLPALRRTLEAQGLTVEKLAATTDPSLAPSSSPPGQEARTEHGAPAHTPGAFAGFEDQHGGPGSGAQKDQREHPAHGRAGHLAQSEPARSDGPSTHAGGARDTVELRSRVTN